VYRTAFLPALLALLVVGFSLEDRPPAAASPLPAVGFDSARAFGPEERPPRDSLRELGAAFPLRPAGSPGDAGVADRVAAAFAGNGFRVRRERRTGRTVEGPQELEAVVGVRPGLSDRRIVVLAHRDAVGRGALAELSGTAALLELARVFRSRGPRSEVRGGERPRVVGRELRKTLVLVSTSGGAAGGAGAGSWARAAREGARVDAVLVLGDLAGTRPRRPWVVPWSNADDPPALRLRRTVEAAVRAEGAASPGGTRAAAQWVRRAVPATLGEVGEVAAAGLPAVGLSVAGERGPAPDAPVSEARLDAMGRAALRGVSAIDAAGRRPLAGPPGIVALRNVVPDWSLRLLVGALLLPALLAAVDALARARRRGLPVGRAVSRVLALAAVGLAAWAWLRLLGLVGALDAPPGPVLAGASLAERLVSLSALLAGALALLALRPALGLRFRLRSARARAAALPVAAQRRRRFARPGAATAAQGPAIAVVLSALATLVWVFNPYAAALLLPLAHLWLAVATGGPRWRGPLGAVALVAGALPLLLVPFAYAAAWDAGPLAVAWTAVLAAAGGHLSLATAAVVAILLACALWLVRTLARPAEPAPADDPPPSARFVTRGPLSYAGPGSLGGTRSALRR